MPSVRLFTALLSIVLAVAAMAGVSTSVSAHEHLRNGSFDQGTTGTQFWATQNATVTSCSSADDGSALRLASTSSSSASAFQLINGPLASGTYTLSGKAIRTDGNRVLQIYLNSRDANDEDIGQSMPTVTPSSTYGDFAVEVSVLPGAVSAKLEFQVQPGSGTGTVICIDSLSLEGPPLATATPEATSTPPPSATGTASPTPTATPTATGTPPPSLAFRNGSFEDGASGWQNFGGDLDVTRTTKVSGLQAGVLSSNTTSTKWAYQTVLVDPARYYEFRGYLQPAAGVANSLLRISWYASADGSGEAISTTDSTAGVPGGLTAFVWVTTGPVQPPPGARTARVRVLLTPAGTAPASLFMDDLEFLLSAPPSATATPAVPTAVPVQPTSTATPALTLVETRTSTFAVLSVTVTPSPEPTRVADVSSTRLVVIPTRVAEVEAVSNVVARDNDGGVPLIWLVGAGAFVAGLGGAYLQGRRKP